MASRARLKGLLRPQNGVALKAKTVALRRADPCQASQASGSVQASAWISCKGTGAANYFRSYDLRHTAATLLIYAGRTINEVAEHLGHVDPGFTARTYTHIYRDAEKRRGVAMEEAIRRAGGSLNAERRGGLPMSQRVLLSMQRPGRRQPWPW